MTAPINWQELITDHYARFSKHRQGSHVREAA